MLPAAPPGHPISSYRTYLEAQRAVDFLSDEKFPVQHVSIVGSDLKMVERVTGRLTYGRVALAGAFSGAYFGGFVGLLLGLFGDDWGILLPAILIGAAFGMIFGVLSYAATGGRRDFTSTSQIVAAQYAVWCADEQAAEALRVLGGLEGGTGAVKQSPAPAEAPVPSGVQAVQPPVSGPTYSEMIARQKAEQVGEQQRQDEAAEHVQPPRDQSSPPAPNDGTGQKKV